MQSWNHFPQRGLSRVQKKNGAETTSDTASHWDTCHRFNALKYYHEAYRDVLPFSSWLTRAITFSSSRVRYFARSEGYNDKMPLVDPFEPILQAFFRHFRFDTLRGRVQVNTLHYRSVSSPSLSLRVDVNLSWRDCSSRSNDTVARN